MAIDQTNPSSHPPLVGLPRPQSHQCPDVPATVLGQAPSSATLAKWFEALAAIQRSAGRSYGFSAQAAAAVCEPGGLDAGFVISLTDVGVSDGLTNCRAPRWQIDASYFAENVTQVDVQPAILQQVSEDGRTLYHDAMQCDQRVDEYVVSAPIFDRDARVVGVVYGVRLTSSDNNRHGIRPLEALWVQLVAETVTGAIIRNELEADLVRNRVMFESAFAPQIVQQLLQNPAALTASERELTILFADLREFTRASEHLGPNETYRMLSDVMNRFTDQVMQHGGVIIDYYGDGMAAMWNAPTDQPEHPVMACSAALAIVRQLTELNEDWSGKLRQPLRIGIGLHTGTAIVGNAGSNRHLKYGPRGYAVNLTSRIESATKRLGVTIAMSANVHNRVNRHFITRRLCKARLAGIDDPVEVFELVAKADANLESGVLDKLWRYEEALRAFESGDVALAEQILNNKTCEDVPTQILVDAIEARQTTSTHGAIIDLNSTES